MKPANRGAREVLTCNVNTTKQRTQHSHRGRRATEHPNMDHPKAAKTRLQAGRKRAKRLKHEARCPVEHSNSTKRTEEPESHPRKGGHWIGNPELKAPREKRKRPGETGRPGTSEQEPQGWRTSLEGRDGHRAPSVRETPWVREGTPPEATPVPPSQPQKPRPFSRGKRGVEAEAPCIETSCSKIER